MNILIVGGGNIGYYLAERLSGSHYVVLIEKKLTVGEEIAGKTNVMVILGDGCDPQVLKKAGVKKADVVAAVTGNDIDNIIICQLAKDIYNVGRTVAIVNNPKNQIVFTKLGIDVAIDSTAIIAKIIEDEIGWEDFVNLFAFKKGNLSLLRIDLPETSPIINMPIKELNLPEDSVIVAVIRNNKILVPTQDFILREKDEIITITKAGNESDLFKNLIGEIEE
ncbi:MAG TPA: NAD-binding protein [Candidatus Ratteibacteria bacterium]|nr:NAD-binding protein [Candidatus Ratteibacteria bacterium]